MITTKKLTRVGHSLGFLLDKNLQKNLKLEKGDFVELRIKKIIGDDK